MRDENVMWVIVRCLGVALAVFILATPAWAQRACTRSDIAGVWELYIGGGVVDGEWSGWSACRVTVGPRGAVTGPCVDDDGSASRLVGGQLTVRNTCAVAGRFVVEIEGRRVTLAVPRAALSRSRELVAGGARVGLGGSLFSALFQMVRL